MNFLPLPLFYIESDGGNCYNEPSSDQPTQHKEFT